MLYPSTPVGTSTDAALLAESGLAELRRQWLRETLLAALLLTVACTAAGRLAAFPPWFALKALLLLGLTAPLMWQALAAHRHRVFGVANRLTLWRLALVLALAACIAEPIQARPQLAWALVAFATAAALLDAADGPLARASGLASEFGARFDMETDALLLLVLCALLVQLDKTGPWVLVAGLLRYAFVAAAWVWHWLARPLPARLRRKSVCVLQIVCLIVGLAPPVGAPLAAAIAALGLAALVWSFAVDVAWLARRRQQPWEMPT